MTANPHAVSAIRKRLAEVSGELITIEKRWRVLREEHHALSQTLRMFEPNADVGQIKPKRPYRRVVSGKLSVLILDALRASGRPMTLAEIVGAIDERARGISDVSRRIQATLNYLARSGALVAKEGTVGNAGKRRGIRVWSVDYPFGPCPRGELTTGTSLD